MSSIRLGLKENRTQYRPGEEIAGAATWELDDAPETAEVRLCWFTQGKGTMDAAVVETTVLAEPLAADMRTFSFRAPSAPYSFSGKLISLIWAVELVINPGKHCERLEIVIGPDAEEIVLPQIPQPKAPFIQTH